MIRPAARALALLLALALPAGAETITLQSTTSTQNSGLLDAILPLFEEATGHEVRVVAVGTGQALRNAERGDGDVVLVHAPEAEAAFVAAGHGIERRELMSNAFVILGPAADPAGIAGGTDAAAALAAIAAARAPFASRGDDSGTHRAELRLWDAAGIDPRPGSGRWYLQAGQGMGATLNLAVGLGAYVLSDDATWAAFGNKGDFAVMVAGDPALVNRYGVIAVNPERHPHVAAGPAAELVDWLTGPEGQAAIGAYEIGGVRVFVPGAQ